MPIHEERGEDFTAVYFGESGHSGYVRAGEHRTSIVRKDTGNAFAKDLAEEHPERQDQVAELRPLWLCGSSGRKEREGRERVGHTDSRGEILSQTNDRRVK